MNRPLRRKVATADEGDDDEQQQACDFEESPGAKARRACGAMRAGERKAAARCRQGRATCAAKFRCRHGYLLRGRGVPKQHKREMKIEQAGAPQGAARMARTDLCLLR